MINRSERPPDRRQLTCDDMWDAAARWDQFIRLPLDQRLAIRRSAEGRTMLEQYRFLAKLRQQDGCWPWRGGRRAPDVGVFKFRGQTLDLARAAYQLFIGPIPWDCDISMTCGNSLCARPDHVVVSIRPEHRR